MNKKEQTAYAEAIKKRTQEKGLKIGYLLKQVGISRSHWHFIKNGERPLTEDNKKKIEKILK